MEEEIRPGQESKEIKDNFSDRLREYGRNLREDAANILQNFSRGVNNEMVREISRLVRTPQQIHEYLNEKGAVEAHESRVVGTRADKTPIRANMGPGNPNVYAWLARLTEPPAKLSQRLSDRVENY